jgi:hypothetical protein
VTAFTHIWVAFVCARSTISTQFFQHKVTTSLLAVFCAHNMHLKSALFPTTLASTLLCSATKILPRAPHAAVQLPASVDLHNVMIKPRSDFEPRMVPLPRTRYAAQPLGERLGANSSPAKVKRTMLGARQGTCDAGYALCDGAFPVPKFVLVREI